MSRTRSLDAAVERMLREPRATEVHTEPCEHCPTALKERSMGPHEYDPEMDEFLESFRSGAPLHEVAFRCAWRREKLCKGFCDWLIANRDSR